MVTSTVFYHEVFTVTGDDRLTTYTEIEHRVSSAILSIAARTMVVALILEGLRMIADIFIKRRRARERAEADREWLAWLKRKETAEKEDREFNELPPVGTVKQAS